MATGGDNVVTKQSTRRDSAVGDLAGGQERREHARARYQVDVTLESESNFYNGFTEDISAGGLFVATYDTKEIGTRLTLEFTLPGRTTPISVHGEVRWLRVLNPATPDVTPGMGVRLATLIRRVFSS